MEYRCTNHPRLCVYEINDAVPLDRHILLYDHLDRFLCNYASEKALIVFGSFADGSTGVERKSSARNKHVHLSNGVVERTSRSMPSLTMGRTSCNRHSAVLPPA